MNRFPLEQHWYELENTMSILLGKKSFLLKLASILVLIIKIDGVGIQKTYTWSYRSQCTRYERLFGKTCRTETYLFEPLRIMSTPLPVFMTLMWATFGFNRTMKYLMPQSIYCPKGDHRWTIFRRALLTYEWYMKNFKVNSGQFFEKLFMVILFTLTLFVRNLLTLIRQRNIFSYFILLEISHLEFEPCYTFKFLTKI